MRSQRPAPDYVDYLGLANELDALLPRADVVAICVARFAPQKAHGVLLEALAGALQGQEPEVRHGRSSQAARDGQQQVLAPRALARQPKLRTSTQ